MAGLEYIDNMRPGIIGQGVMGGLGMETAWIQLGTPWALKWKNHFPLSVDLGLFFLGMVSTSQNDIQILKSLELKSIIDCSRHDFSRDGLSPRCEPILVPTMLLGGSAADIGVKPSSHRVADMHLRGHLMARFTSMEQYPDFSPLGTLAGGAIALRGSYILWKAR